MSEQIDPWEKLFTGAGTSFGTFRMKVPGGWLYMVRSSSPTPSVALQFVPKPQRAKMDRDLSVINALT